MSGSEAMSTSIVFGKNLAMARKRKGMTQRYLAHRINEITGGHVAVQNVSNWECGVHRQLPGPETIVVIAQVLDADPVDLCLVAGKSHPDVSHALLNDARFAEHAHQLLESYRCPECGSLPGRHTEDCNAIN